MIKFFRRETVGGKFLGLPACILHATKRRVGDDHVHA